MVVMNRSELVDALAAKALNLQAGEVDAAVKAITGLMSDTLAKGQRIEIRGFGSFCLRALRPRVGRNPKTGEPVEISARRAVHFKPGKELKLMVDGSRFGFPLEGDEADTREA
jgi:integration host factor subunit beta